MSWPRCFPPLGTWNWLIFGFILMALELLAPGVFLFWLGLAALLVGLLSFAINPSWQTQLLMFAVFAVAAVPVWRHFARSRLSRSQSNPFLNKRTEALVGREFTLEKPIIDGSGTVRIDDTIWRVAGPDAPAGSRVKIVQRRRRQPDGGGGVSSSARLLHRSAKWCSGSKFSVQLLAQLREAIAVAGHRVRPSLPRAAPTAGPACTVGEASSQAVRSAREVSGSPRATPR